MDSGSVDALLHTLQRSDLQPACRLVLLVAAAGAGKTAALRRWAAERGGPTAYLALQPDDNVPERFLARVLAALHAPVQDIPAAPGEDAARWVDALLVQPPGFAFLLDGYEIITAALVHAIVATTLDYLPAHVRLVIAARTIPPLPVARLRVRRQLVELARSPCGM